jgi:hypothetical protein
LIAGSSQGHLAAGLLAGVTFIFISVISQEKKYYVTFKNSDWSVRLLEFNFRFYHLLAEYP